MDLELGGRVALVTGGSQGIGLATAVRLAQEGCTLHLAARTEEDLEAARKKIQSLASTDVVIHALDLSVRANVDRLVDECGDLDILVNNAGAIPAGTLDSIDDEAWREAWDLKVFGYIQLCRRILAAMRKRGRGVIVNVIGAGGERPTAGYIAGSVGNAGLMALTRALGASSLRDGVRVVGVNPGLIETERLRALLEGVARSRLDDAERWRELLPKDDSPGQPEHVADLVAFLASDRSANTSGTIVTIDGGSSAR